MPLTPRDIWLKSAKRTTGQLFIDQLEDVYTERYDFEEEDRLIDRIKQCGKLDTDCSVWRGSSDEKGEMLGRQNHQRNRRRAALKEKRKAIKKKFVRLG